MKKISFRCLRLLRNGLNRLYGEYIAYKVSKLASNFDIVFAQRVLLNQKVIEKIRKAGAKFIFDFDDAIFLHSPDSVRNIVHAASGVISGSHFTHDYASHHNPVSALIPSSVPVDLYEEKDARTDCGPKVRIGWIGSSFTLEYLTPVYAPIRELVAAGYEVELVVAGTWGAKDQLKKAEGIDLVEIDFYGPEDLPRIVRDIDIGIMPLTDTPWERGKCAMKALLYMAGGKPVVCSPVGEVLHIIEDGLNGYLADTPDEWTEKLRLLVADPALRQRVGRAGRATVERSYSTAVCFKDLYDFLARVSQLPL